MGSAPRSLLLFVLLVSPVFGSSALAQCSASVEGTHEIEFARGSLPPTAIPFVLAELAINPHCSDLGVDFLGGSGTADFDNGSVRINADSQYGVLGKASDLLIQCLFDPSNCDLAPSVTPCSWNARKPIASLAGATDIYAVDVGVDGPWTVKKNVTITICQTFEIFSPAANTIQQEMGMSGVITAAESFGDTEVTKAKGSLTLSGTVAGQSLGNMTVEVESITIIPEQASIDEVQTVQIDLQPGNNQIEESITATVSGEVVAKSTGLYGMIAGSATLAVAFGNTIEIGNFTGVGGGDLPSGVVVRGLSDGLVYALAPDVTSLPPSVQPSVLLLHPVSPNPMGEKAKGQFELFADRELSLRIYDCRGRQVRTLVDSSLFPAGSHDWGWDGRDDNGRQLSAGVYFYRLELPEQAWSRKLVLLR